MSSTPINLIVLLGATASGKTRLAVETARLLNAEIISADSRQVYRGMDLGTGKDLQEYAEIAYHMIDIVDPGHVFNVFEFQQRFVPQFDDIQRRGKLPLLCGGTGMYLEAILRNEQMVNAPLNPQLRRQLEPLSDSALQQHLQQLQPQLHNNSDFGDRERTLRAIEIATARADAAVQPLVPALSPLVFGLRWPRQTLRQRISQRLQERLENGMIEEVARLQTAGVAWSTLEFYGLEYRFIARYLQQQLTRNDMIQQLGSAIHQFAKRQETWFRRMERQGTVIHWLEGDGQPLPQLLAVIHQLHHS